MSPARKLLVASLAVVPLIAGCAWHRQVVIEEEKVQRTIQTEPVPGPTETPPKPSPQSANPTFRQVIEERSTEVRVIEETPVP
jgi:hypothetical protein